jgi:hypothetical protein
MTIRNAANVDSFIKCPFCAGHEVVSAEAAEIIANQIDECVNLLEEMPVKTELHNIRNAILNHQERATDVDELLR